MKKIIFYFGLCCLVIALMSFKHSNPIANYSFVVMGDDRLAPADTVGDPSTANIYHLKRIFSEIAKMSPLPKYVFINGDLILGYTGGDTARYTHELREWIKIYKSSPLASSGVKLVAVPGNHEIVDKINKHKIPSAAQEKIFVREMKAYIRGDNGPKATGLIPGTDSLTTDQSRLTYSFNFDGDHFVVFSTDAVGRPSRVPWHWLKKDLAEARKNGARHIFLFGHKPPFPSNYKGETGLDECKADRDSMWSVIEKYNCDIYFASHLHLWDTVHPYHKKTWEIICGNAGAPLIKDWTPSYYGYTIVNVGEKIHVISMGHDVDKKHSTEPTPNNPTVVKAKLTIE